jgi:hypothetical protein
MKDDLWASFAMKHGYTASRDSRERRERLRRVVDDIAYALYRGKMATAARVSRPHVAAANRAWLSAEFTQRRAPSPPRPSESRRFAESPGKWHTKKKPRPASPRRRPASPPPKPRAPMNSESNDEFFARTQIPRRRG